MAEKICSLEKQGGGGSKPLEIPLIECYPPIYSSTLGWGETYVTIPCEDYKSLDIGSFVKDAGSAYYRSEAYIWGIDANNNQTTLFSYSQVSASAYSQSNLHYDISNYDAIKFYLKPVANGNTGGGMRYNNVVFS